jgi:hypothetical protein
VNKTEQIRPNERAVIGGNSPPETPREALERRTLELQASASAWLREVKVIDTKPIADAAGKLIRELTALASEADDARKIESGPLHRAWQDCNAAWKPIIERPGTTRTALEKLLKPWLIKLDEEKREAERKAQKEAEAAARAAEEAQERAAEALEAAARGEKAGTDENVLAMAEAAETANQAALRAQEDAERVVSRKVGAGGNFEVNGHRRSVGLKTEEIIVHAIPKNSPRKVRIISLAKILTNVLLNLPDDALDWFEEAIMKAANKAFKATGEIPPGCSTTVTQKVRA